MALLGNTNRIYSAPRSQPEGRGIDASWAFTLFFKKATVLRGFFVTGVTGRELGRDNTTGPLQRPYLIHFLLLEGARLVKAPHSVQGLAMDKTDACSFKHDAFFRGVPFISRI